MKDPKVSQSTAIERMPVLDVLRGFALIGILVMNIEWFNRVDYGNGILPETQGVDRWLSYVVNYFVTGNFRTLFSLLFGMGFALILARSLDNGRAFVLPYMRRLLALAMFGILHSILLWDGDILLSYAFSAAALLITLFLDWKWIALALVGLVGLVVGIDLPDFYLRVMVLVAGVALLVRCERTVDIFGRTPPVSAVIFAQLGILAAVLFVSSFFISILSHFRIDFAEVMIYTSLSAYFAFRFQQSTQKRLLSAALLTYVLPLVVSIVLGVIAYQAPQRDVFSSLDAQTLAAEKGSNQNAPNQAKSEVIQSAQQIQLEQDAEMINRILSAKKEQQAHIALLSTGSYSAIMKFHFDEFSNGGYLVPIFRSFFTFPLFLLGFWLVRSGVVLRPSEHLSLLKRLALIGLPVGWGMSLFASSIAVGHVDGVLGDGFDLAHNIVRLSNLATSLAYLSIVVLMCHSVSFFSKIQLLAPYGRMALTNYLTQTLIQAGLFFGWGFGLFGMERAQQLGVAIIVIVVQIVWSHWWLARFRFGPVEWVWRALAYWTPPTMRIAKPAMSG